MHYEALFVVKATLKPQPMNHNITTLPRRFLYRNFAKDSPLVPIYINITPYMAAQCLEQSFCNTVSDWSSMTSAFIQVKRNMAANACVPTDMKVIS